MKPQPEQMDDPLHRFDQWLETSRVSPKAGMLERTRERIAAGEDPTDSVIDVLLMPDPRMKNPSMADAVRHRLSESDSPVKVVYMWKWLAPVAAAAAIAMAVSLFNTGPSQVRMEAGPPMASQLVTPEGVEDPELTRIFALAANLPAPADVSELQSVDQLALLFK